MAIRAKHHGIRSMGPAGLHRLNPSRQHFSQCIRRNHHDRLRAHHTQSTDKEIRNKSHTLESRDARALHEPGNRRRPRLRGHHTSESTIRRGRCTCLTYHGADHRPIALSSISSSQTSPGCGSQTRDKIPIKADPVSDFGTLSPQVSPRLEFQACDCKGPGGRYSSSTPLPWCVSPFSVTRYLGSCHKHRPAPHPSQPVDNDNIPIGKDARRISTIREFSSTYEKSQLPVAMFVHYSEPSPTQ